jgi:hemoglobin
MTMSGSNPYQLLGGDEGVRQLAYTFYQVMSERPEAAKIRAMHAESTADVSEKLYQYLSGWMGGPHLYAQKFGTVCLTKPHLKFPIGADERDQWLACMDEALERIGAPEDVKQMLKMPMFHIADTVKNLDKASLCSEEEESCPD